MDDVYRKSDADRDHYEQIISERDLYIQELELKNEKLLEFKSKNKGGDRDRDRERERDRDRE